jgi:hypothetical protein
MSGVGPGDSHPDPCPCSLLERPFRLRAKVTELEEEVAKLRSELAGAKNAAAAAKADNIALVERLRCVVTVTRCTYVPKRQVCCIQSSKPRPIARVFQVRRRGFKAAA